MKSKLIRILLITAGILLIPLIAMQFTSEVNWEMADFVVGAVLLIGAQVAYLILAGFVPKQYKTLLAIVVVLLLALVWAELAVGIFDSPWAGD